MITTKPWLVSDREKCTIIVPTTDVQPHLVENISCPCSPDVAIYNPIVKQLGVKPLIIHNSFSIGKFNPKSLNEVEIEE